jgi:hypothetical protein
VTDVAAAMETLMRAEFSARIAFQENIIRTWSPVGGRPTSIEATARTHTGGAWFDIAVCRLLLGEANAARDAFARASELMHSALEVMSPQSLATYCAALESAVLSGDRALADRIATNAVDPEPRPSLIGDRLEWALALPALVTEDDARASHHARRATTVPDKTAWYPGLGDAIAAVAAHDGPGLAQALDRVLRKHAAYARAKKSWCYNAGPCLLCVPAAVLLKLAARRQVHVDDLAGRRAKIPLALIHSSTTPAAKADINADFVPDPLISP